MIKKLEQYVFSLGILIGLSFLFAYLMKFDFFTFTIFLMIFDALLVYANLMPVWTLVLIMVFLTLQAYFLVKNGGLKK